MTVGVASVRAPGRPLGGVLLVAALGALVAFLAVAGAASAIEPHAPIKIGSNADLATFCESTGPPGCSGSGTRTNPYVISGWEIAATDAHGVAVANTTVHLVLRDLRVANGGTRFDGLTLTSVRNVTVQDSAFEGNRNGVAVSKSSSVVLQRLTANSTAVGVLLDASTGVVVRDSVFPQGERGFFLRTSTGNTFRDNRVTLASGQFGFWFADNTSVANSIDETNLVNEVSMRWYVNVTGPLTVRDARVDVRGITNVAQMLVYRSTDVRVEDAFLTNGTARGLHVWQSDEVVVTGSNASVNDGIGVHVQQSRRSRFLDGDASLNGGDGVRIEGSLAPGGSNQVGRVVAVGNKARAVALIDAPGASAFDVVARGNGAGILASGGSGISIADNRVSRSVGVGINVSVTGAGLSVTGNVVEDNGDDGIRIVRSTGPIDVRSNEVERNKGRGVALERIAQDLVFAENDLRANGKAGLSVVRTRASTFLDNRIEHHPRNVLLANSSLNRFWDDEILKSDDQTGIHFEDVYSYDNDFPPNTTINGVPVHWRTGLRGTAEKPVVLDDVRVGIANFTNVAQIGLHNSSHVRLVRPVASDGAGVGILLHQSHDVSVVDAVVTDNVGTGILVRSATSVIESRGSSNVIEGATVTGNGKAANDAGVKIQGSATTGNVVRASNVSGNAPVGIRLEQAGARNVVSGNMVHGNARAGVVLDRATLATVQGNEIGNHSRAIEIRGSVSNLVQGNAITIGRPAYGLYFRDEQSYDNDVLSNTTVNGVGVQWLTYVEGREGAPAVLRPAPVEVRGITNVAQVMVFKSSWLVLEDVVAANGTDRGVYLYKSSQVELANATARNSSVGVDLGSTLASRVLDAKVTGDGVGVRLNASSGNTVARATAEGTKVAVRFVSSDNNRVWGTNATGAATPVIDDPSFKVGKPNEGKNLLVDAGLDHRVDVGEDVTFTGAIVASPFRNEPVVRQRWDFGDGKTIDVVGGNASRPRHAFETPGRFVTRLTVHTPTATYDDTAVVTVGGSAENALKFRITCDPSTINATVGENVTFDCTLLLVDGEAQPLQVVVKERTDEVANVTVDILPDGGTPFSFWYVANATGDHLLRVGTSTVVHVIATDPPPSEDDDRFLPPSPLAAVAALAAAALTRAKDRRR